MKTNGKIFPYSHNFLRVARWLCAVIFHAVNSKFKYKYLIVIYVQICWSYTIHVLQYTLKISIWNYLSLSSIIFLL